MFEQTLNGPDFYISVGRNKRDLDEYGPETDSASVLLNSSESETIFVTKTMRFVCLDRRRIMSVVLECDGGYR